MTINDYEDLDKLNDDIKYININIKKIDNEVIYYFKKHGQNYYYSESIDDNIGYIYVDYDTFIKGNKLMESIINNIPDNLNKLEIAKYLYINIGKLISYDINIIPEKNETINYYQFSSINNIWGALSNLKATNQAYCKLYLYLCSYFDISCDIINVNDKKNLANKLTIDNNTLIVDLTSDIPYIQAGYKTRYFSDYNETLELDKKIKYINDNYNEIKLDMILKNNSEDMVNILLNIQTILDIDSIDPISLEIILNIIFMKYYSDMNIRINNFYINDINSRRHFLVITYKGKYYSYNYNKSTFMEINEKDLHDNLDSDRIGIYLKEDLSLI